MKQCPSCKTTYTDESLQFCLADGAQLISAGSAAETVQMSFGNEPVRVNIPPDSMPTVFAQPPTVQNQPAKKVLGLIVAAIVGMFLLLAIAGIAGFILYRQTGNENSTAAASPSPIVSPKTSPTAAPIDETAKLKEEMANLKKQLEDQKNQKSNSPVETFSPPKQTERTARVNSPGDGFLALRSLPNSELGERLDKIPHGATLTVLGCPKASNIGKMPGRWCQVIYNGQKGWAFDAFLTYQ